MNLKDLTLFENEHFLVVNKPFGLVVNDSHTLKGAESLQQMLKKAYFKDISDFDSEENKEFLMRNGIIHRLDKETSGILIVAKTPEFFTAVQSQFKDREVDKEYIAVCYKDRQIPSNEFIVDAPIGRNPKNRMRFAIVETGRNALTEFKVIEEINTENGNFLVLRCFPKTGRTHQIRVHLAAMGLAVLGDKIYSGKMRTKKNKDMFERQMLHAAKITFNDPISGNDFTFEAEMPEDMKNVINFLKTVKN
jgi:23S rRNA pseudouridine1911/1915/1917 synthase